MLRLLSLYCVSGRAVECWGGLMGHGRILLSVDLARSQLFFVNLWEGRTPFRFVTSGVPPKEEFQSRALGKSEGTQRTLVKNWGPGHGRPHMRAQGPATERPYLRTGLRLRVTMCVCDQCGPRAWAGPHGPHWFQLHCTLDNMATTRFLAPWLEF